MRTTNSNLGNSSLGKYKNNWTICPMFLCSCQIIPSCSHTAEIYGQSWQEKLALHPRQFCSGGEGESWLFILLLAVDPMGTSCAGLEGWLYCIPTNWAYRTSWQSRKCFLQEKTTVKGRWINEGKGRDGLVGTEELSASFSEGAQRIQ